MRNKFSELIATGVASFQYQPILSEMPTTDPICIEYNNVFGPALDTHMSEVNGIRIITGHNIANTEKWNEFCNSNKWGGYDFGDSGNWTLNEFLGRYGLCGRVGQLNGDIVCFVEECTCTCDETNENLNESKEDEFFNILEKHLDAAIDEGFSKRCSPTTPQDLEKVFKQYMKKHFD